jgi:hypothetical protein
MRTLESTVGTLMAGPEIQDRKLDLHFEGRPDTQGANFETL